MNPSLTIIAATNFSSLSNNAVNYAAGLAKASRAKLVLFHSFSLSVHSANSLITADERIALAKEKAQSLDKATSDASLLYKSGMANYLEVITAQNSSLQNDLDVVAIKLEKLNAAINLYRALGGGVE